jgi:hypothetical protein
VRNFILAVESREARCAKHVARIGDIEKFMRKFHRESSKGEATWVARFRLKIDLEEIGCEVMECIGSSGGQF